MKTNCNSLWVRYNGKKDIQSGFCKFLYLKNMVPRDKVILSVSEYTIHMPRPAKDIAGLSPHHGHPVHKLGWRTRRPWDTWNTVFIFTPALINFLLTDHQKLLLSLNFFVLLQDIIFSSPAGYLEVQGETLTDSCPDPKPLLSFFPTPVSLWQNNMKWLPKSGLFIYPTLYLYICIINKMIDTKASHFYLTTSCSPFKVQLSFWK